MCWDCGVRTGVTPAVDNHRTGIVEQLCDRCTNRWRPWMRRKDQCVAGSPEWTLAW